MQYNPFFHEIGEAAKNWRETVYNESDLNASQGLGVFDVAWLRRSLPKKFQEVVTARSTSSNRYKAPEDSTDQTEATSHSSENSDTGALMDMSTYQLELRRTASEPIAATRKRSIAEIIANIRTSSGLSFAEPLAERLEYLVAVSSEEFPEQEPMSPQSLEDFLAMIRSIPHSAYPDLVLTYEGNVRAEWTKSYNKHFAVEFFGASEVRFVVFAPDSKKSFNTNKCSGLSTLDSLIDLVRPYGVLDWVVDPPIRTAA